MADFIEIPPSRLPPDTLNALLEEFASRDGTDYGEREIDLEQKVAELQRQLAAGEVLILYDSASENWDLLPKEQARDWLQSD
jgi:uncharacterized protein YheU (UPF0270 family)